MVLAVAEHRSDLPSLPRNKNGMNGKCPQSTKTAGASIRPPAYPWTGHELLAALRAELAEEEHTDTISFDRLAEIAGTSKSTAHHRFALSAPAAGGYLPVLARKAVAGKTPCLRRRTLPTLSEPGASPSGSCHRANLQVRGVAASTARPDPLNRWNGIQPARSWSPPWATPAGARREASGCRGNRFAPLFKPRPGGIPDLRGRHGRLASYQAGRLESLAPNRDLVRTPPALPWALVRSAGAAQGHHPLRAA